MQLLGGDKRVRVEGRQHPCQEKEGG